MQVIDEKTTVYRLYDSVQEQVDFADSVPASRYERHDQCRRRSFIGRVFSGWDEVKRATRQAWPEGLEVLERMVRDLDDTPLDRPQCRRRRTRFAEDDGHELDYDRLRSGQPYWRTSRRENTRGPSTITVLVDVGANSHVDRREILWRGAAAIALTSSSSSGGNEATFCEALFTASIGTAAIGCLMSVSRRAVQAVDGGLGVLNDDLRQAVAVDVGDRR